MAMPQVDFGWIQEALELYKKNFAVLVVAALITFALGVATLGILYVPLLIGMNLMALRLIDRDATKPEIGDVFTGFQYFLPALLFCLVWTVILVVVNSVLSYVPCVGSLVAIVVTIGLYAALVFAPFLIHEKNMDFWTASMTSIKKVFENPGPLLGLGAITVILSGLGTFLCFVGIALTLPLYSLTIGIAYRHIFDEQETAPEPGLGGTPPAAPPAAGPVSPAVPPADAPAEPIIEPPPRADTQPPANLENEPDESDDSHEKQVP